MTTGGAGHHVLVPWTPGPLIDPDARPDRDDLDELVDELFPDVEGGPGPFDVALLAGGGGVLAWALLTDQGTGWVVLAAVLLVLGAILPIRSASRRLRARGAGASAYQLLDCSDASVSRLTEAYGELVTLASAVDDEVAERAVTAAHQALVETASLLDGRPPAVAAEREYAEARARAVASLVAMLRSDPSVRRGDDSRRAAVARAKHELEVATGIGSLTSLEALAREIADRRTS